MIEETGEEDGDPAPVGTMSGKINCPFCQKTILPESAFCRHCGKPVGTAAESGDRKSVLARTADFMRDPQGALEAINEYFERFPDDPEVRDVSFTRLCILQLYNLGAINQFDFKPTHNDILRHAHEVGELPVSLANGILTVSKVAKASLRKDMLDALRAACDICAKELEKLWSQAEKEAKSLLIDGKTKAVVDKITMEDAYDKAEIHYASYEKGDLDAALKGFTYLKELAPSDAYFRNILGTIYLTKGQHLDALQEYLYGLSLDPGQGALTANTLRTLCGLSLFPAAVEVARHCECHEQDAENVEIKAFAALARAEVAMFLTSACQVNPKDFTPSAPDVQREYKPPARPWLTEPTETEDTASILSDIKIFISYRRSGGLDYAERLERALLGAYPSMHVFRDESVLVAGQDFRGRIRDEIDKADVFLALIDETWAGNRSGGPNRLADSRDVLRREVARAMTREIPVIPVLVGHAAMPAEMTLPKELRSLARLHAQRIREEQFDNDFGRLQSAMTRLVTEKKQHDRWVEEELETVEELLEKDPEAGKKKMDEMFEPVIRKAPKYMPGKSLQGQGVHQTEVTFGGTWEINATTILQQALTLQIVVEDADGQTFTGDLIMTPPLGLGLTSREGVRGGWMPILDPDSGLVLGMYLDGVKEGTTPFQVQIPFHRRAGASFIGADAEGTTYVSRNLDPRTRVI